MTLNRVLVFAALLAAATCRVEEKPVAATLKEGDVCKLGGVNTGKGKDRSDDCPEGTACTEGKFDKRGRSKFTCEPPRVCCLAAAACDAGYKAVAATDCTEEEFVGGVCTVASICCDQKVCQRGEE